MSKNKKIFFNASWSKCNAGSTLTHKKKKKNKNRSLAAHGHVERACIPLALRLAAEIDASKVKPLGRALRNKQTQRKMKRTRFIFGARVSYFVLQHSRPCSLHPSQSLPPCADSHACFISIHFPCSSWHSRFTSHASPGIHASFSWLLLAFMFHGSSWHSRFYSQCLFLAFMPHFPCSSSHSCFTPLAFMPRFPCSCTRHTSGLSQATISP